MKADELKVGESAVIEYVAEDAPNKNRILDFGIVKGTKITVMKKLSFGDPVVIKARNTLIALRKNDLSFISVVEEK